MVQGCSSQVCEARLAQLVQIWVAAVVGRGREIRVPLFCGSCSQGSYKQRWHRVDTSIRGLSLLFCVVPARSWDPLKPSLHHNSE